jgi:ribose transport system substrate-binding protein
VAPATAAPATAAPATAAPATAAPATGQTIAFSWPYLAAEVAGPLLAAAEKQAGVRGYQFLKSGIQEAKLDLQLAEINQWIAMGVTGITILPIDANAMGPVVEKGHQGGVKAIAGYADHIPGEDGWMGWNDAQGAGIVAGLATLHVLNNYGGVAKIAALTDQPLTQRSKRRVMDCVQFIIDGVPQGEMVVHEEAVFAADALAKTQQILQAHPEINVIICVADDGCSGVVQGMKLAGKKPADIWVAGYDGAKQPLTMVKNGEMIGAVAALPLEAVGNMAIDLPADLIEGKGVKNRMIDYAVVTNGDDEEIDKLLAVYG